MDIPYGVAQCLRIGISEEITKAIESLKYGTVNDEQIKNLKAAVEWYDEYCIVGIRVINERYEYLIKLYNHKKRMN